MNRNPSKNNRHKIKRPSQKMFNRVLDRVAQRLADSYLKKPTACTTIRCHPIPGLSADQQLLIDEMIVNRFSKIVGQKGYHPLIVAESYSR